MTIYRHKVLAIRFWSDILVISLSFLTTVFLFKHSLNLLDFGFAAFLIIGWYISTRSNNLYDEFRNKQGFTYEIFATLNNIFLQALLTGLFLFMVDHKIYGRSFVFIYTCLLLFFLPVEKIVLKKFTLYLRKKGKNIRKVLIVGAGKAGMDYYNLIKRYPGFGYKVVGFLDDEMKPALNGHYLGNVHQLEEIFVGGREINEVVVALPNNATQQISKVVHTSNNNGVRVRMIPDYSAMLNSKSGIELFGGIPMITFRHEPLEEHHWRLSKRLFDVVFSFVVLTAICSWLFPIIAILIKISSKGPVFFIQQRSGKDNRTFYCIKFRSMFLNGTTEKQATKNDKRVTRVGRFLRKSNLDEFPQFLNVLAGDMSIVGPRPHMLTQTTEYSRIIDQYMVRHLIKPGITGWAQVNGYRGETRNHQDMEKRVEYDVWYLENWSLLLDIKIVFITLWNIIKGEENAY